LPFPQAGPISNHFPRRVPSCRCSAEALRRRGDRDSFRIRS